MSRDVPPACADLALVTAGGRVRLMHERAVFLEHLNVIVAADLHLGKGETMRVHGVGVPRGELDATLARLGSAVRRSGASRVIVVGDLLHAGVGLTDSMITHVGSFLSGLGARLQVVVGNHDRAIGRVAQAWGLEVLGETWSEGGFRFIHAPDEQQDAFTWCGHLHPAVVLKRGGDGAKLACFWLRRRHGVLPAMGRLTAGGAIRPSRGDGVYAVAGGEIVTLAEYLPG